MPFCELIAIDAVTRSEVERACSQDLVFTVRYGFSNNAISRKLSIFTDVAYGTKMFLFYNIINTRDEKLAHPGLEGKTRFRNNPVKSIMTGSSWNESGWAALVSKLRGFSMKLIENGGTTAVYPQGSVQSRFGFIALWWLTLLYVWVRV